MYRGLKLLIEAPVRLILEQDPASIKTFQLVTLNFIRY